MKKIMKKTFILSMAALFGIGLASCMGEKKINNESTRLVLSTQELDGVFNPFYSTSATDSNIVGMTQLSMLGSDKNGNVAYGENEAVVVLDYAEITSTDENDEVITTYQFVLKNNVKFSNGSPLTMKDVLFNLYEYLDPVYYGSATLYSTDIVGLKEYRTQSSNEHEQDAFNQSFLDLADDRVSRLMECAEYVLDEAKAEEKTLKLEEFKERLKAEADYNGESHKTVLEDFERACTMFKEELDTDYKNNMGTYDSIKYTDKTGKEVSLSTDTEAFLFNEGYIQWNKQDKKFDYSFGEASKSWSKEEAIEKVYISNVPNNILQIVTQWQTATNLREYFANLEKEKHFSETERVYKNISGIQFANRTETVEVNGKAYPAPQYDETGAVKNNTNEVLEIKIHDVDPKAIWNFSIGIAPMYYYSSPELIEKFDYVENFGVEYSSQTFQDSVIKDQKKIGLPVGAGAYKATTKSGDSSKADSSSFYDHNVVYYERNEYFVLGTPKIKYINYQVIPQKQLISALYANQVHFVEPSCKQEVIDDLNANKSKGYNSSYVMTNGYGYIGINASKIPDVAVRRAIMHAVNIQLCLDYYPGYSSAIYRPMTKASWAYPDNLTQQYYAFDATGATSEKLVQDAGYALRDGVYQKDGHKLKYTFTIAGDSTDHPAYLALKRASEILNEHGFDISVYPDPNALKKLNEGALTVWAAAWSASVDPDMYQVYHIDSTATSTSNWGYKAIKSNKVKYSYEYNKIVELSDLIDKGRQTLIQSQRKAIYAEALDIVMDLAVELPTYQRSDLYAYNTNIIDESTMTPRKDITPYNGPLSRIWELSLNEN